MWNLIFSGVLVGLPAGFGVYMLVNRSGDDHPATGFVLLLYAAVLGTFFAYGIPEGKLLSGNFRLKMPSVFVLGAILGAVAGFRNRRRNKK